MIIKPDKEDGNRTIVEKQIRNRRRRKLVVDEVKEIDSATMKAQLSDTSSILGTLELAPPTRKLMLLKEIGGVDKLYCMTGRIVHNKAISKV
jgi:cohesin complex subunit SCC1